MMWERVKNMKKIFITFLGLFLVLGISGCQKNHVDVEDVAKKIVYFSQDLLQAEVNEIEEILQNVNDEFKNQMKENIIKDVQIKVLGNVGNDLKSYDLPITIQSVAIEEGDSQIVTVKFVDQKQKEGQTVLQMQDDGKQVTYVGYRK